MSHDLFILDDLNAWCELGVMGYAFPVEVLRDHGCGIADVSMISGIAMQYYPGTTVLSIQFDAGQRTVIVFLGHPKWTKFQPMAPTPIELARDPLREVENPPQQPNDAFSAKHIEEFLQKYKEQHGLDKLPGPMVKYPTWVTTSGTSMVVSGSPIPNWSTLPLLAKYQSGPISGAGV